MRPRARPLVARPPVDHAEEHLAIIRAEEQALDTVEAERDRLRAAGRRAIGIDGTDAGRHAAGSLRAALADAGVGMYPAVALGLLVSVDQLQTTALTVLGPEISGTLGIPRPAYALVLLVKTLVVTLAALPLAALVQRSPRRALVSITTAFAWVALTAATAFTVSVWGLLWIAVAAGVATASVRSIHQPLLLDSYPTSARVRVMSFYRGFDNVGDIAGPLVILLCTATLGLTWRGVFLGMAAVALIAAISASRLRDPGFGRWDTGKVRALVTTGATDIVEGEEDDGRLGFFEISRRVLLVPTVRRILVAHAVLGMFLAPFLTYLAFFLQERWGMDPGQRSLLFAALPVFGLAGLRIFGTRGERMFREDPARLINLASLLMGLGITCLALAAFAPVFAVMVVLFGAALAAVAIMVPAMALPMYSVVPAHMRPHLGALTGVFLTGVGGLSGLLLLGGVERRFGTAGAILSLALPGIAAGLVLRGAARTVNADLDRMVDELLEEEEVRTLTAGGARLPMMACRKIDFSYGQLQVLFGVDFTVDDGEMVALLGTNGAGKSTLLRVISGLGLPTRGTVRLRGTDITFVPAERRVGLGICQIPGGRAVFGPMTVAENLRVIGHTHGRNRRAVEAGIDASFEAFPRLAERRNQLASTLSGGEQQMLGLATAFIIHPRLLLIDELSLGLAPKVVGELLEMVREINSKGTAVVLVEQSVNVALSVVQHAYFMEKGEVRFDGVASELLARPDLLRSVFLDGAGKVLDTATNGQRRTFAAAAVSGRRFREPS